MRSLLSLFTLVALACPAPAAEPARPNIVVIMSDDMGFSDIGCYGGEIHTPNLDTLAAGGVRFTQFYNTARCCPTRASLLTGLYPHQAGVGHMMEDKGPKFPGYRGDLNRNCRTLAEVVKPAGYRAYAVGKWHVTRHAGPKAPRDNWPLQRGFDRYYGTIHGAGSYFDPSTLTRDNKPISAFADPEYKPETYYYTDAISDHAVRFVADHDKQHKDKPFLMYVAYTAAHWPMHALPADIAKYKGKYSTGYDPVRKARLEKAAKLGLVDPKQGVSPGAGDWDKVTNKEWEAASMEVYAAMVDRMDQGIGKIVAELKRTGQFDNTLILFLQDNGGCAEAQGRQPKENHPNIARPAKPTLTPLALDALLPPGSVPPQTRAGFPVRMGPKVMPGPADTYIAYGRAWANVSNTPFREYKHWVHEGGISTPLIAHWPTGIRAKGELRTQPSHLIDIMATCVELSGAKYPAKVEENAITLYEGKSLVPAFANKPLARPAIFWEHEGNRAVRAGDWKLVAKGPGAKWELYNIATDRTEAHDLAAKHPEKVKELVAMWETWASRAKVLPWIWKPAYTRAEPSADPPKHRVLAQDKGHVALIGTDGKVEWEVACKYNSHDIALLPNGNFLLHTGATTVTEMTPKKEVVWKYDAKPKAGYKGRVEVHSFQRLADGNTLVAESGNRRIVEVDKDGKIVKEIPLTVEHPDPHRDTRMVRKLDSGNYLVCQEGDGCVREYDAKGKIVWEYKLDLGGRKVSAGHGPEGHGTSVYGALRLTNGNTVIAGGNNNRVLEVNKAGKIVWSIDQKELPGITLAWVTTLHVLPNGNLIVGNCHAGPDNPQLFEVTRDKKVVWTFKDFKTFGNSLAAAQVLDIKGVKR